MLRAFRGRRATPISTPVQAKNVVGAEACEVSLAVHSPLDRAQRNPRRFVATPAFYIDKVGDQAPDAGVLATLILLPGGQFIKANYGQLMSDFVDAALASDENCTRSDALGHYRIKNGMFRGEFDTSASLQRSHIGWEIGGALAQRREHWIGRYHESEIALEQIALVTTLGQEKLDLKLERTLTRISNHDVMQHASKTGFKLYHRPFHNSVSGLSGDSFLLFCDERVLHFDCFDGRALKTLQRVFYGLESGSTFVGKVTGDAQHVASQLSLVQPQRGLQYSMKLQANVSDAKVEGQFSFAYPRTSNEDVREGTESRTYERVWDWL